MTFNPDTDVLYDEAISLQARAEKYDGEMQRFKRLIRDTELELLSDGFMPDAEPEIRIACSQLRANQILEEKHGDLFRYLDDEGAAISAMRLRNEGIVTAGWAEGLALNSARKSFYEPKPKDELES